MLTMVKTKSNSCCICGMVMPLFSVAMCKPRRGGAKTEKLARTRSQLPQLPKPEFSASSTWSEKSKRRGPLESNVLPCHGWSGKVLWTVAMTSPRFCKLEEMDKRKEHEQRCKVHVYIYIYQCRKRPVQFPSTVWFVLLPPVTIHHLHQKQFRKTVPKCCRNRVSCCGIVVHNDVDRSSGKVNSSGWHGNS